MLFLNNLTKEFKMAEEKKSKFSVRKKGEAKEPKAKKVKDESESSGRRGRTSEFAGKKLKLLTKENPKRAGSGAFKRFELYSDVKTVDDFIAAGGTYGDIKYDLEAGYIEVV